LARMLPRVMGFGRVGSAWLSLGALAPYLFGPHRYKANGLWYLSASPSKKSMQRFKMKVGNLLVPGNNDPWPEVRDTLNRRGLKSSLSFVLHLE